MDVDFKAAPSLGSAFKIAAEDATVVERPGFNRIFLFDLFSPWAAISEFQSTHPLTGKRIRALCTHAKRCHIPSVFDWQKIEEEGLTLDQGKLYGSFFFDLFFYALPSLSALAGLVACYTVSGRFQFPLFFSRPEDEVLVIVVSFTALIIFAQASIIVPQL